MHKTELHSDCEHELFKKNQIRNKNKEWKYHKSTYM